MSSENINLDFSSAPLLKAECLVKHYRFGKKRIEVLHGLDFEVDQRDFVALHGASGAGKSTLLHLLGGLDSADSGEIFFKNKSISAMSAARLSRFRNREIGFIFQSYHLFPDFSALENVCLPGKIARRSISDLRKSAEQLLEKVGLKDRMSHRPYELSGGEQQRVAIARALINEPSIVFADEPTGNLDSISGQAIVTLLERIRAEHSLALILATHDRSIGNRASRVVHLIDGKIQKSI